MNIYIHNKEMKIPFDALIIKRNLKINIQKFRLKAYIKDFNPLVVMTCLHSVAVVSHSLHIVSLSIKLQIQVPALSN